MSVLKDNGSVTMLNCTETMHTNFKRFIIQVLIVFDLDNNCHRLSHVSKQFPLSNISQIMNIVMLLGVAIYCNDFIKAIECISNNA